MTALIKYEAACRALAECKAVDEVKAWADKAAAMQAYGRMANDKSLEVDAAEIRIRAERRLGEMLAQTKAAGGLKPSATLKRGPVVVANDHGKQAPKLASVGISKGLSSRAQKLAAVPEAEFEAEVGGWRERVTAEGARVSARLQRAGERELNKKAPAPTEQQGEAYGDIDPVAEWEKTQKELEKAHAVVDALGADDPKAELAKQIRIRQGIEARLSDEMEKCKGLARQLDSYGKWYAELRKLTGLDERKDITRFVREAKNAKESAL